MEVQLLIKSATNAKHKDKTNEKKFLNSITHLSLDNKNIETIENLELCHNLNVLYLSENSIMQI
jgi:Leucine-rich repeat (LRR) protein